MPDTRCLVIDDVDQALQCMTSFGRAVAEPAACAVRASMLTFATRRGWTTVTHAAFAAWGIALIEQDDRHWGILDPLFPLPPAHSRTERLRATRRVANGVVAHSAAPDTSRLSQVDHVNLLDDAASSGGTLLRAIRRLQGDGIRVPSVVLCAASRVAIEALQRHVVGITPKVFLPGNWTVLHLRDACAYLPHTGRPLGGPPIALANGKIIERRAPSFTVRGSLAEVAYIDKQVSASVEGAYRDVAARMGELLERPCMCAGFAFAR